ncbi:MAG: succinate dehydrogenase assembly factor 2 [Alphaproteobacteria bacterium]
MQSQDFAIKDRLNRLRYRSAHRGCKETDLILGGYAEHYLDQLNPQELAIFEDFLEEEDVDIWSWLTEKSQPEKSAYQPLLKVLRTVQCVA